MTMLFGKKNPGKAAQPVPQKTESSMGGEMKGNAGYGGEGGSSSTEEQMPIHEVVAQHGPANEIHMKHGEGMHETTSHHGKHKHKATHGSAGEAHDHARAASGADGEQGESMDGGMGGGEMSPASSGSGIPGM